MDRSTIRRTIRTLTNLAFAPDYTCFPPVDRCRLPAHATFARSSIALRLPRIWRLPTGLAANKKRRGDAKHGAIMARGWIITAFTLAALSSGGLVRAQSIIQSDPPAKAQTPPKQQPAAKPPAKKQSGGAATQGLVSPPQDEKPVHPAIQAVADRAAMYFIDEHAFCAAYFAVVGGCSAENDPAKPKLTQLGQLLMGRGLTYEKQHNLAPGSVKAKAEEAEKGMAAKVWRCGSVNLV